VTDKGIGGSVLGGSVNGARLSVRAKAIIDLRIAYVAGGLWSANLVVCLACGRGALWGFAHFWWFLAVAAVFAISAFVWLRWRGSALAVVLALAAGLCLAGLRTEPLEFGSLSSPTIAHHRISATVQIRERPRIARTAGTVGIASGQIRWHAAGKLTEFSVGRLRYHVDLPVVLQGMSPDESALKVALKPGSTQHVAAMVLPAQPARPQAAILAIRGSPTQLLEPGLLEKATQSVADKLGLASTHLSVDSRGLVPGLVVGDDSGVPADLVDDMRRVGMSHLTAVSGSNLAIVTGVILWLATRLRLKRSAAIACAATGMMMFVLVVGPQPSVLRAAVMGAIALVAILSGRPRVGASALALSVAILLIVDPWLSVSLGFALSVAATAGLLVQAQVSQRPSLLGATLAAQVATAPIVVGLGQGLPLIGVAANLAAAPVVPVATVVGSATALLALVSVPLAMHLAVVASVPTWWIAHVARFCAQVPAGVLPWPRGLWGSLALLALMALLGLAWHRRVQWNRLAAPVGLAFGLLALLFVRPANGSKTPWPVPHWSAVVCDVGQGDASAIATSPGHAVVIDAGPDPDSVDRCLKDLAVTTIDLLVLTHFHADHVEGLPGLLAHRSIGQVLVSPLAQPAGEVLRVQGWFKEQRVSMKVAAVGEVGRIDQVEYQVLWPRRIIHGQGSDPNNASVTVLIATPQLRILFPGDLEPAAQEELINSLAPIHVDVVKIPHHGSRQQSPRLVSWSGANVAIVSAGLGNPYGHPNQHTLETWKRAGAVIARTDQDSDVAVVKVGSQVGFVGRSQHGSP